jgi:processive 1,2-diacylglycerol beta-glucosyltransferase
MIRLYDTQSNKLLGTITESELRFLINQLEEESPDDRDYYLEAATLDLLEEDGGDRPLITMLRQALGGRDGMEIRWERTEGEPHRP